MVSEQFKTYQRSLLLARMSMTTLLKSLNVKFTDQSIAKLASIMSDKYLKRISWRFNADKARSKINKYTKNAPTFFSFLQNQHKLIVRTIVQANRNIHAEFRRLN